MSELLLLEEDEELQLQSLSHELLLELSPLLITIESILFGSIFLRFFDCDFELRIFFISSPSESELEDKTIGTILFGLVLTR